MRAIQVTLEFESDESCATLFHRVKEAIAQNLRVSDGVLRRIEVHELTNVRYQP